MVTPGTVYQWARKNMKKSEVDTYRSDLYIKVTPKSRDMVERLWSKEYPKPHTFKDQIEGESWYEFPFCAMGQWIVHEERRKKRDASKHMARHSGTNLAGLPGLK